MISQFWKPGVQILVQRAETRGLRDHPSLSTPVSPSLGWLPVLRGCGQSLPPSSRHLHLYVVSDIPRLCPLFWHNPKWSPHREIFNLNHICKDFFPPQINEQIQVPGIRILLPFGEPFPAHHSPASRKFYCWMPFGIQSNYMRGLYKYHVQGLVNLTKGHPPKPIFCKEALEFQRLLWEPHPRTLPGPPVRDSRTQP